MDFFVVANFVRMICRKSSDQCEDVVLKERRTKDAVQLPIYAFTATFSTATRSSPVTGPSGRAE